MRKVDLRKNIMKILENVNYTLRKKCRKDAENFTDIFPKMLEIREFPEIFLCREGGFGKKKLIRILENILGKH